MSTNFQVYLTESLIKLKSFCRRKHSHIVERIEKSLSALKKSKEVNCLSMEHFEPFKLACESTSLDLIREALQGLQRIVSTSAQSKPLKSSDFIHENFEKNCMNEIMRVVCCCGINSSEEIERKVVQNILTIVSSSYEIHSDYLFFGIRTCFHIYLSSKNTLNQTCARATLAQIVHVTTDRSKNFLNLFDKLLKEQKDKENGEKDLGMFEKIKVTCFKEIKIDSKELKINALEKNDEEKGKEICRNAVLHVITNRVFKQPTGKYGFCVVCKNPAFHYCLQTKDSVCSMDCKIQNLVNISQSTKKDEKTRHFVSIVLLAVLYQNDSLMLFRSFCELASQKTEKEDNQDYKDDSKKPMHLRSKEMALDLILHIFKSSTSVIKRSKQFLELVKTDLVSLLMHTVFEKSSSVSGTSIAIFLELSKNFKTHLKTEIGVFLECVFSKIIESKNSNYSQKIMYLLVYLKFCSDDQLLVDIFLNYDCNSKTFTIYRNMVSLLEKITQNELIIEDWINAEEETQIKTTALECIKRLFKSLIKRAKIPAVQQDEKENSPLKSKSNKENEPSDRDIRKTEGFKLQYSWKKEKEQILQRAIHKFNENPKMGISMLESINSPETKNAASIAKFLTSHSKLKKEAIGKYLAAPENFEVLSAYSFLFDFEQILIDEAIRKFLKEFLLCGESQMIDRVMGRFAIKYCYDNPDLFSSSDVAHILAFSIMLLNTDLHSKNIQNKMSKSEFVNNNQKVIQNEKIDPGFLEGIYDRIAAKEIKLELEEKTQKEYLSPKAHEEMFVKEKQKMYENVKKIVDIENSKEDEFVNTSRDNVEIVYRMFEVVWSSSLASMSILLERSDDEKIVSLCLDTYKYAIELSTFFSMDIIKQAYVNTLTNLTLLGTEKTMKPKNIKAIQTILGIAYESANSLEDSWFVVLKCISNIKHLHLVGIGAKTDKQHFLIDKEEMKNLKERYISDQKGDQNSTNGEKVNKEVNEKAVTLLIEQNKVDRIFVNSVNLTDEKLIPFSKYLCNVAEEEIVNKVSPRVFCLEKIVETVCYNLHRPVGVWVKILKYIERLFVNGAKFENKNISKFVLNSYRVIVSRFLASEKFRLNQDFQMILMEPFLKVFEESKIFEVREIILQSVFRLAQKHFNDLESGWNVIFKIGSSAVKDSREKIASSAMDLAVLFKTNRILLRRNKRVFSCLLEFLSGALKSYLSTIYVSALKLIFYFIIEKNTLVHCDSVKKTQNEEEEFSFEETMYKTIENLVSFVFEIGYDIESKKLCIDYLCKFLSDLGETLPHGVLEIIMKEHLLKKINRFTSKKSERNLASTKEWAGKYVWTEMVFRNFCHSIVTIIIKNKMDSVVSNLVVTLALLQTKNDVLVSGVALDVLERLQSELKTGKIKMSGKNISFMRRIQNEFSSKVKRILDKELSKKIEE